MPERIDVCLEEILQRLPDDSYAMKDLNCLHQEYGNGEVTGGEPVPVLNCTLLQCGHTRVVDYETGSTDVYSEDIDELDVCRRGLPTAKIDRRTAGPEQSDTNPGMPGPFAIGA